MTTLKDVDTLLFDMDGTLTDLWKRYRDPFFRAIDKVRPDHDKERLYEIFEKITADFLKTSEGSSRIQKFKTFIKSRRETGGSIFDTVRVLKTVFKDPLAFKDIVPLEGVERTLEILQLRGYKLALVTNAGDKTVSVAKEKLKILESFDVLVTRNTVKKIKPYPDSILYACEYLGKKPEECAMIGDFPQDVLAGKNAGTKTISILGANKKYTEKDIKQSNPDVILESFQDLLEIFPQI
ncbi:MAG: HAD family hydrolase [Candidatus Thorarchaeota archaeon]